MIFFVYYIAALALVGAEMRGLLRSQWLNTPQWPGIVWVAILLITYAVQVAVCYSMASVGDWPIAVVRWQPGVTANIVALLALALLQSFSLLGLFRTGARVWVIATGAVLMAAVSFAPVVTNADVYAYVGNALLGRAAYAPPATPFPGDLAAINLWWRAPMAPTTYGPLWLAVARAVTEPFATLALKLTALRVLDATLFGALVILLRTYGVPARILTIVAVNPAFYFQFVLNAHNDMLPTCIAVGAALAAPAIAWLAVLLIAIAALVKAPYVLLGLPVLVRVKPAGGRAVAVVVAIAVALAASWFAGGAPYLQALLQHLEASHLEGAVHGVAIAAALVAIAAAVAGARRLRSAVWLLPMLGAYTAPWYALWSVPYAIGARRILTYFAVWFPFVSILAEPSLVRLWTFAFVLPAAVILSLRFARSPQPLQGGPSYR